MRRILLGTCVLVLLGCQPPNDQSHPQSNQAEQSVAHSDGANASAFVGCYTIDKAKPAQIKITHDGSSYAMQMKEPKGAPTVWDKPETIDAISVDDAWEFYQVNTLSLDKSDVEAVIARADRMMVLAKVKPSATNINPLLDSPYVVYIFRGSNTIYQVACDDEQLNLSFH